MTKSTLMSMALSTEKDVDDRFEKIDQLLKDTSALTSDEYDHCFKYQNRAADLIRKGYIYGTINMTVREIELACNNLVEAKSLLMYIDCYIRNREDLRQGTQPN